MKKLGIVILLLAVVGLVGGSRLMRLNNPDAISGQEKQELFFPKTINLQQLDTLLVDSLQVVKDSTELNWAAQLLGWRKFQAGHYKIDHGFTYDAFLSKLAKGIQDPISITIIPGQRKDSIITYLSQHLRFDSTAVKKVLADSTFLAHDNITPKTLVAHFFPATYDIYWTSTPKKALNRIFKEFDNKVVPFYRQNKTEHDLSFNEVLALASIVEREALHDDEKAKISGLYHNRLKKDMLLQADPTVNYALHERRRLYLKDYKVDDPYNTYIHKGLPPGPINNPSLSSIKAALNPADHGYLYMVAQPNGYHAFSKTYAEHERQAEKWRKYLEKMESEKDTTASKNF